MMGYEPVLCQYYHDPLTDEIELMTTADLIEATRCVESMRDVGLCDAPPDRWG